MSVQQIKTMNRLKVILSVPEQVEEALDGRTKRWLSLNIRMPENELSKKMKGRKPFTQEEIDSINTVLKASIKLS